MLTNERITRDTREVGEDAATNADVGLPVTATDSHHSTMQTTGHWSTR